MQLFGLMCEASEHMGPMQPFRGQRGNNRDGYPHPNGYCHPAMASLPLPSSLPNFPYAPIGFPVQQPRGSPAPYSSLPHHAENSFYMGSDRRGTATPFRGAAASLLAAISHHGRAPEVQDQPPSTPDVLPGNVSGFDSALGSGTFQAPSGSASSCEALVQPPMSATAELALPNHASNAVLTGYEALVGTSGSGPQVPAHKEVQKTGVQNSASEGSSKEGVHDLMPDSRGSASSWGSPIVLPNFGDLSHAGSFSWSDESPVTGLAWDPVHASMAGTLKPGALFETSPTIMPNGPTSGGANQQQRAVPPPAGIHCTSSNMRVTPLTKEAKSSSMANLSTPPGLNAPGAMAEDAGLSKAGAGGTAPSTSSDLGNQKAVQRNLSADLQAITSASAPPGIPGADNTNRLPASDAFASAQVQVEADVTQNPFVPLETEWGQVPTAGLNWAEESDSAYQVLQPGPSTGFQKPALDDNATGAAAFAGLSLGDAYGNTSHGTDDGKKPRDRLRQQFPAGADAGPGNRYQSGSAAIKYGDARTSTHDMTMPQAASNSEGVETSGAFGSGSSPALSSSSRLHRHSDRILPASVRANLAGAFDLPGLRDQSSFTKDDAWGQHGAQRRSSGAIHKQPSFGSLDIGAPPGMLPEGGVMARHYSGHMDRLGSGGMGPRAGNVTSRSPSRGMGCPFGQAAARPELWGPARGLMPAMYLRRALLLPPIVSSPGPHNQQ